jgi:Protein of unknown function (DUF3987)
MHAVGGRTESWSADYSNPDSVTEDEKAWSEPVDFLGDNDLTGVPALRSEHLPVVLYDFAADIGARMGVDPASVALGALVACAGVISDDWRVQPKAYDHSWTENPRIWGAIVGDPSIRKTPVIAACTRPVEMLDKAARKQHAASMEAYQIALAKWKKDGSDPETEPTKPLLDRYLAEDMTIEALTEVLRDDRQARQRVPAKKVLIRQDEMSEFFAGLDRYRSNSRGGGDRGAYLRLYNGGHHVLDRVGRGPFACSNWSACFIGGIQPGPIQRIAREAAEDGLLQRFCFAVPAVQGRGEERRPNPAIMNRYETLFPALVALHPPRVATIAAFESTEEMQTVVFHADAHPYREATNDLAEVMMAMPDTSPRIKAALGKWPGLFARLSLIFHLIEIADARAREAQAPMLTVIPAETARRVAVYMREVLLPHLLRADTVMFSTTQTGHARWIAGFILAKARPRLTLRDVVQAYSPLSTTLAL